MANKTRQYPVPFSIFSSLNSDGIPIVTATFGGISVNESRRNMVSIRISNYKDWLNNFNWKLQVVGSGDQWFDCQLVKGIPGKGHIHYVNMMVECPISGGLLMENDENWPRVSFQVFDESSAIVLDLRNLLVCNESPTIHHVDLAACTMVTDDHFHRIPEWIEYHRLLGFGRFFVQIDSPNFDYYQIFLQKYIERHPNLVQLVPFYFESQRRPQDSARHDCLYRSKALTKYLALFDVDEFFHFELKQQSLTDFLEMKLSDTVTAVEALMYFFRHCEDRPIDDNALALESYQVKQAVPFVRGRQKAIYLARKASYVTAHEPASEDPTITLNSATEYPPKGLWRDKNHVIVRDSELALEYSSIIKQELRESSFTIDDVDIDESYFSCVTNSSQIYPSF